MNLDQKITIVYSLLGTVAGFISSLFNGPLSLVSLFLYLISLLILPKIGERKKKFPWLLGNSLLTFILVWLLVWTLLFNLW